MHEHGDMNQPNGSADLFRSNGTARSHGEPEPDLHALCAASAPGVFAICEVDDLGELPRGLRRGSRCDP
jgi:hypothetical protein